ncbi:MAG: hypothetical protein AAFP26_03405 [Planctomycetota bacterium]
MGVAVRAMAVVLGVWGVCAGGCVSGDARAVETPGVWRAPGPFVAGEVRVSGLTRLDRRADDEVVLVLHLEVMDQFGDPVKVLGAVDVVLTPAASAGAARDAVRWSVGFTGARESTSYFDPSSRTYRFVLGDLPGWALALGEADARDARLDVVLRTPAPGGSDRSVRELRAQSVFGG